MHIHTVFPRFETRIKFKIVFPLSSLFRWRAGQTVSSADQLNLTDMEESVMSSSAHPSSSNVAAMAKAAAPSPALALTQSHISAEDRSKLEEEREKLYAALVSCMAFLLVREIELRNLPYFSVLQKLVRFFFLRDILVFFSPPFLLKCKNLEVCHF